MRVKVGNLSFDVPITDAVFTAEELKELAMLLAGKEAVPIPVPSQTSNKPTAEDEHIIHDLSLIKAADISSMTFVMIANRILGIKTSKRQIAASYPGIEQAVDKWLRRPIQDTFIGLFFSKARTPLIGQVLIAVGLNKQNQLVALGIEESSAPDQFLKALIQRGLKPKDVQVGVLGLDEGLESAFRKAFPKATITRDWDSIIEKAPEKSKDALRDITFLKNEKTSRAAVAKLIKGSSEVKKLLEPIQDSLFAYYSFPEGLWRVLRNLNPIYRLQREYISRAKHVKSERDAWLLVAWCTMRLQYHWFKIPVDAPQLSNLRYVKELEERRT